MNKLKAEATLSYNKNFSPNWDQSIYGPEDFIYNIILWMGPDVDIRNLKNYWQPGKQGIQQFNYNYAWYNNPWFVAYQDLNGYYRDAPTGTLKLTYDIAKGLSLMVRSGANINITNTTQKTPLSLINYTSTTDGAYFQSSESAFQIISDFLLSYKKQITKDFNFDISGGGSNRYYKDNYLSASASGLNVPEVYNLGNSKRPVSATNSLSEEKVNSLYGFVNLSFKDAIFLSLTGRNDWSSALPISHDAYFYPSASLSVVLSNLIRMPDYISFLKLRGSWSNISSDFQPYSAFGTYSYGTNYNQTSPSLYMGGTLYNQNLQPSKTINRE
ncbi:MAG: SusC/RagA family TonB-linked outer membrane protein, partial [Chitinophagaceae bacterium]